MSERNLFNELSDGLKEIRDARDLVQIRWHDARGGHSEWQHMGDDSPLKMYVIDSVGFILQESDEVIHIAAHVHEQDQEYNDGHYCGDLQIPKVSILDIWTIK